jgi:hypothetical protein
MQTAAEKKLVQAKNPRPLPPPPHFCNRPKKNDTNFLSNLCSNDKLTIYLV